MAGIKDRALFQTLKTVVERVGIESVIYELSMVCADSADPYRKDAKRLLDISDVLYELVNGETFVHPSRIEE